MIPGVGGVAEKTMKLTEMRIGGTGKEVGAGAGAGMNVDEETGAELIRGGR